MLGTSISYFIRTSHGLCRSIVVMAVLWLASITSAAQNEMSADTVAIKSSARVLPEYELSWPDSISMAARYRYLQYQNLAFDYHRPDMTITMPSMTFTPGQAAIASWRGGAVVAHGAMADMPALMHIDKGAIGIYQHAGSWEFHAGVMANKYGYFRGVHTQYGIEGDISYRISPRLSATVFGSYYFGRPPVMGPGMPMPPSMIGYYDASKFGGYMDVTVSDRFGVQVGAQSVQRVGTTCFEPEPIVTPYVKLGNGKRKVHIGLPVGQILYHLLRK